MSQKIWYQLLAWENWVSGKIIGTVSGSIFSFLDYLYSVISISNFLMLSVIVGLAVYIFKLQKQNDNLQKRHELLKKVERYHPEAIQDINDRKYIKNVLPEQLKRYADRNRR